MTGLPRRPAVLFLLALLGVLLAVGLVVADLAGPVGAAVYAAAVLGLLAVGTLRARRAAAARARPAPHCTCCDGDHTAPVRVV